ncbi:MULTISPECIES: MltA domain-containing protein [unclassified Ruegeria]|uniref:murein transglycosylase A n=1 Tax=unclassified Ruegeria TaxID=2625375 RepID=UPI001AD98EBA|nr:MULTISPECIES: MltA domain-containing protein [unclassified Ruegeria]MBO9412225.1 murein transglycosylase A [Ruegeria sp. R8_1]MBO9417469.1 murein transglycosylase A [Ruegeria sp. R8_2]
MIAALRSFLLGAVMATSASAEATRSILSFDDLDGWTADDHGAALSVFLNTCGDLEDPDWRALCAVARTYQADAARSFFELFFRPVLVEDGDDALFTGYFEPELDGSRTRTERYKYPIYKMPPEARADGPWLSRRDILTGEAMNGRGLEIAWVDDPVELFFLQIQGSGRIRLPDGGGLRVGYGGANGHPYRSIGKELIRQGALDAHQVSAQMIKSWVRKNPEAGAELLFHNPSYVFFREVTRVAPEFGPLGAMNRSVTTMRSIAADPAYTPLGAPVWVEKDGKDPLRRLMIAQDTGAAIKGAQRADIFFGTGDEAGRAAGRLKDSGRMVVLLPIQRAYALLPDAF